MNKKIARRVSRVLETVYHSLLVVSKTPKAIGLVWETSASLTLTVGLFAIVGGLVPLAGLYINKLIIDTVVLAAQTPGSERSPRMEHIFCLTDLGHPFSLSQATRSQRCDIS